MVVFFRLGLGGFGGRGGYLVILDTGGFFLFGGDGFRGRFIFE